jgi:hypothetical protein
MRRTLAALAAAVTLSGPMLFQPSDALAVKQEQDGLVNVAIGVEDVQIAIPVSVAANLVANACDLLDVGDVLVLANKVDKSGNARTTDCDAKGDQAVTIFNNAG